MAVAIVSCNDCRARITDVTLDDGEGIDSPRVIAIVKVIADDHRATCTVYRRWEAYATRVGMDTGHFVPLALVRGGVPS